MTQQNDFNNENFEELFKQSLSSEKTFEGHIVKGVVINIDPNYLTVDVGLKSEGRVLINEFKDKEGLIPEIKVGQTVEVYIERYEDQDGSIMLSREKARREEEWYDLEKLFQAETPVVGFVTKRVKGGFSVMVGDTLAFLPGSQLDVRPIKNINSLVNTDQTLQILKMDKKRYNIVVSRKAIISKNLSDNPELQEKYEEGQIVEGIVKNITPYGAFIELASADGLLHVTDISWSRINHPSEILQVGQGVKLKVIKINPENNRISLGMKQLTQDPWGKITEKYKKGDIFDAKVTNITDYGVFMALADGIEGLVHISEMSWVKKNINTRVEFKVGNETKVAILEVDAVKRRINLSIKQCMSNPWVDYAKNNPEGSEVMVKVKDINENGLLVSLTEELEGFVKSNDLSWDGRGKELLGNYKAGDEIKVKIIKHDLEKDKILLSVKHLSEAPVMASFGDISKGSLVKAKVTAHTTEGLEVEVKSGVVGFIKKFDISLDREQQNVETYPVGSEVEAIVISLNSTSRTLGLSIKSAEIAEQRKQMTTGDDGSSSFADAFADALNKKQETK